MITIWNEEYVAEEYQRLLRNFGFSLDIYRGNTLYCRKLLKEALLGLRELTESLNEKRLVVGSYYRTYRRRILTVYQELTHDEVGLKKYR